MTTPDAEFRLRGPQVDLLGVGPTNAEARAYFLGKYNRTGTLGSSPRRRLQHGFLSADDYYETMVSKLVRQGIRWLDVGCGRNVFPSNYEGAKELARRCSAFAGVDPDANVHENDLLTDRFQGVIEDYETDRRFDLVTLRMVAEHVQEPERTADKLAQLTAAGGLVVIYTPWKWGPMSLIASTVPFSLHNPLKRLIWDSESRDTFPTAYKMNTRNALKRLFEPRGFDETYFCALDDCSIFTRYGVLNSMEMSLRNVTHWLGLTYPEHCLFAIFRRKA